MTDTIIDLNPENTAAASADKILRRCTRVLLDPTRFFRSDLPAMKTSEILAFGIGNAWAASVLSFFVQTLNSLLVSRLLDRWMQRLLSSEEGFSVWTLSAPSFLYTSGLLLLGPFLYLLFTIFSASMLYFFARILIEDRPNAPEPVTYESALRIKAATLASGWYSIVPVFGGLLSFVADIILSVTGVRERFGVSTRRATAVVLAPYVLLAFFSLLIGAFLILAFIQIPLQDLLAIDLSDGVF